MVLTLEKGLLNNAVKNSKIYHLMEKAHDGWRQEFDRHKPGYGAKMGPLDKQRWDLRLNAASVLAILDFLGLDIDELDVDLKPISITNDEVVAGIANPYTFQLMEIADAAWQETWTLLTHTKAKSEQISERGEVDWRLNMSALLGLLEALDMKEYFLE